MVHDLCNSSPSESRLGSITFQPVIQSDFREPEMIGSWLIRDGVLNCCIVVSCTFYRSHVYVTAVNVALVEKENKFHLHTIFCRGEHSDRISRH